MSEEDRKRILRLDIPSCSVRKDATDDPEWTALESLNGWVLVPIGGILSTIVGWTGTIDLSGYARDYKTFYPTGGVIQEGPQWVCFEGFGQLAITVVSSVPVDLEQLTLTLVANSTPGLLVTNLSAIGLTPTSAQNWETTMFCETQVNMINSTLPALGVCQPVTLKQTGSLMPTASDTLYVAKVVIPSTVASGTGISLSIPAAKVILPGSMDQEPELEYMMRLARSVELANQV